MNRQSTMKRKGQTMVEFALVIPLVIVGIFSVIVFGHLLLTNILTGSAAREGARYGSAIGPGNNGVPRYMDCQGMRDAAMRSLQLSGVSEGDITISIGYDHGSPPSIAPCPPPPDTVFLGDRVTVQVDVAYHTIIPIPFIDINDSWNLSASSGRSIIKDVAVGPAVPPPPPNTPSVYFTTEAQTVNEGDPSPVVYATLHLSEVTDKNVTVIFNVGGSANITDDYTQLPIGNSISIPPGQQEASIEFTIVDDTIFESSETILIAMQNAVHATISNPHEQTITIVDDDDPPLVSFAVADWQTEEEDVLIPVLVQLDHASGLDVDVSVEIDPASTAALDVDYSVEIASSIHFNPGETQKYVNVTLIEDIAYENSEVIILNLVNPVNAEMGLIPTHNLVITDDDVPPVLSFDSAEQNVSEQTGMVTVGMHLDVASGLAVTAPFIIDPASTAVLGEDYIVSTVSPVEIAAGGLGASIILTILDDGDDTELPETIIFDLGTPTNATLGSPNTHIVTIQTLNVSFNTYGQLASEAIGQMFVNMVLSEPTNEDVIVPFSLSGTAGKDVDYTITASPVTIPAGQTTASIIIDVINDILDENDETVIVTMGQPTNAAPGQITEHTAIIQSDDDMPLVSFVLDGQTQLETAGLVNVILQLSAPSGRDILVPYDTTGSSANPGSDYTITGSPISIPAGATTANIQVNLLDDNFFEGDEYLKLQLTTPVNAGLGDITLHTLLIQDDDSPLCDISGMELEVENNHTGNPKFYRVTWTRIVNSSPYNLTLDQASLDWPTTGNNPPSLISAQWDLAKASGPFDWTGNEAISPFTISSNSWLSWDSDRTINTGDLRDWYMTFNLSRELKAGNYTVTLIFRLTDYAGVYCQPISRTTYWAP